MAVKAAACRKSLLTTQYRRIKFQKVARLQTQTRAVSAKHSERNEVERSMISGNFEIFLRQHRTKLVRRLRRQIFRQIVQGRRRRADARQGELVQDDGKYASKMRAKREARALCGVALVL